ncbi:unnamed protein product [Rotaria magnacalcarata]|uniref:Uncharacterized protein n=2 Tax=Rotaria magnacalcarata TaxID=392030 RepID=A0A820CLY1_9BILA|nr:unnamed protein product [Rotaria magnacalcarata]
MSRNQFISIVDYLQSDEGFNSKNFTIIRDEYQKECDGSFPVFMNESALKKIAQKLKIKINNDDDDDDDDDFGILRDCVMPNPHDSQSTVQCKLKSRIPVNTSVTVENSHHFPPQVYSPPTTTNGSSSSESNEAIKLLTDIDCLVNIKKVLPEVSTFIHSFLLKPIPQINESLQGSVESISNSIIDQKPFILDAQCPLYLFVREQMFKYPVVVSVSHSNSTRFRLVEPIRLNDDFDKWEYDHLRGLFDLELVPHDSNSKFPSRWHLADNVSIYCRITIINSNEQIGSSSRFDRLHADSLDAFVRNVCAQENNDRSGDWLKALKAADIFHFEHLASLDRTEWDRIPLLSVNAKRILRAEVDRQRTNIVGEQRRHVITNTIDENKEENSLLNISENQSPSISEHYADIHLVKLYMWHLLHDQPTVKKFGNLAKIETKCVDAAFKEMQCEGYADDGLFLRMKEFFLPLTISQKELNLQWSSDGHIQRAWSEKRNKLLENIKELDTKLKEEIKVFKKYSDDIGKAEQNIIDKERQYSSTVSMITSNNRNTRPTGTIDRFLESIRRSKRHSKEQVAALRLAYTEWEKCKSDLLEKLNSLRDKKIASRTQIMNLENQIEEEKVRLNLIETTLNTPQQPVDNQLVKPPRGLVLYGPPGKLKCLICL